MRKKIVPLFFLTMMASSLILFSTLSCNKNSQNFPTGPTWDERVKDYWGDFPELGDGIPIYTVLPVDTQFIEEISPLGHLSMTHPIPTTHIYWGLKRSYDPLSEGFRRPVYAPANGVITKIIFTHWAHYPDYSVVIRHTNRFMTQFKHLSEIDSSILAKIARPLQEGWDGNKVYIPINAGEVIGKTSADYGQSAALDMGAYDKNVIHFIHPEKYPIPMQHAVCPLKHFNDVLKPIVFSKVKRIAEPRCGEFDFDQLGKLVGNWFLEGTDGWSGPDGYKNYLAFVYDMYDPQYLRVSLGEKLGGSYYRVKGNAPDFKTIDKSSGKVIYKLIGVMEGDEFFGRILSTTVTKTLLVEMIHDEKIKVEIFEGDVNPASFTSNAKFYTR